ncbi:MAG TPA: hypothetical protein VMU25_04800 [Candidatus Paceibacterota bacterium]|nr:hypothetical protein [Candidatus Paceibacterota bacterium]
MIRSLILSVATIGALAIGSTTAANAYVPCSPYVGGMCGQDTQIGIGAMIYHAVGPGGIFDPRHFGGGYGGYGHAYGYRPQPQMMYQQPQVWCVGRDQFGNVVSRTPGAC